MGFKITEYKNKVKVSPEKFDAIIYLICKPGFYDKNSVQIDWKELGGMKWWGNEIPTMIVSIGSPYHLYDIPYAKTYVNTYCPFPTILKTLAGILTGKKPFLGKNPVDPYSGLKKLKN
jgi:beta-N-acetylhexosaminidase